MSARILGAKKRYAFRDYLNPRVLVMLALGFSSGLPFNLIGNTLGYWLRDEGTGLAAIGVLSWVGMAYSLKFLWAPFLDRTQLPVFGVLGRRRGWMLVTQILIGAGLMVMACLDTRHGLGVLGAAALLVAFAASTQDTAIDAFRIESASNADELGLLTSAYTLGFRTALLATEAIILPIAQRLGWNACYAIYGVLMLVGVIGCLRAHEPVKADQAMAAKEAKEPLSTLNGIMDAVTGPFLVFFRAHGTNAILMLAAISLFQIPNYVMGPMTNPLYHDIGLSKDMVGAVRGTIGLFGIFFGVAVGGWASMKLGYMRALLLGGSAQIFGTALYALLPQQHDPLSFALVMGADNFGIAMAGVTLVTYMSSLTSLGYTATQYALLSSTYSWLGKILKGFSGIAVQSMSGQIGLMNAYAVFFLFSAVIGIPALILFAMLARQHGRAQPFAESA